MVIHDDADGETIVKETVSALRECARMVGKIGPSFSEAQLKEMEYAVSQLHNAIALKRRLNDARS